jgi:hypothetical protein
MTSDFFVSADYYQLGVEFHVCGFTVEKCRFLPFAFQQWTSPYITIPPTTPRIALIYVDVGVVVAVTSHTELISRPQRHV